MINLNTNIDNIETILESLKYSSKNSQVFTLNKVTYVFIILLFYFFYEIIKKRKKKRGSDSSKINKNPFCTQCSSKDDINNLVLKYESENFQKVLEKTY